MSSEIQRITETTDQEALGYRSYLLPSGLRVILYFDETPVSYAGYFIGVGSSNDPQRYHGIAHFAEHMLFKGTKKRNARHIINRMEEVGADFNAFTTKEETYVYTAFPGDYFWRVVEIMTDVVRNSSCPEEEIRKERDVIIEEINSYLDSPVDRLFDEYENLLFHGTPLGHNILGTVQSVERITGQAVRGFMRSNYLPHRLVFCYRGKAIDTEALLRFLEEAFPEDKTSLPPSKVQTEKEVPHFPPLPLRQSVTHHYKTYQVHRIIGCPAYSFYDKEKRIVLNLLNNILGGRGMNSRLNMNLREEKGLVYTVESNFTPYQNMGLLSIYFGTTKEKLDKATEAVEEEVRKLSEGLISEEDLRSAKRQIVGQLTVQEDSRESAFLGMGRSFYYFDRYSDIARLKKLFERVTPEELRTIARETFCPERFLTLTYV